MRTIFHLDLDAFFVSVERILKPSLNGKPVVVGGDPQGRGVVAACSYEARAYGLHSGMPIRSAFKLCPHGLYLHGHYEEYIRYSDAVRNILTQYAPSVEPASIDEFYMDFTGCQKLYGSLFSFASFIQREIKEKLSLPCSIGIGSNKTVAKIASDCMKPMGITYVLAGMEQEFLAPMPVETIPGVGKVLKNDLNNKGIYYIRDITNLPSEYFSAVYGKYGTDLWRKAHGQGTEYLSVSEGQKSISKESTFDRDITSRNALKDILFRLTGKVCQNLRDKNWQASSIHIKLRYSDFQTLTRSKKIVPSDDDKFIFETAWDLFDRAITRRIGIRLIGIGVTNFSSFSEQEALFEDKDLKRKKMLRAINILRAKYGFGIIDLGSV